MTVYTPEKGLKVVKGPIFSNFVIADEINRSSPKTQSAMMEAMQERQVTIGNNTDILPSPFFVMANQNPIETEGVFSLPEAQVDRFLFKIMMDYPDEQSEKKVMAENNTVKKFEDYKVKKIVTPEKIVLMQELVGQVYVDNKIKDYIMKIINKTRDKTQDYSSYVELGCSPRATISLYIAAKAEALMKGRNFVIPADVRTVAKDVLRHRMILSFRARTDKMTPDKIIDEIFKAVHTH